MHISELQKWPDRIKQCREETFQSSSFRLQAYSLKNLAKFILLKAHVYPIQRQMHITDEVKINFQSKTNIKINLLTS